MAEEGERITLVPIDEDGEPCGPPQTTWLEPEGRKLN